MRASHLRLQHDSELDYQKEYSSRLSDDLAKKHALQAKQQPRELKVSYLLSWSYV